MYCLVYDYYLELWIFIYVIECEIVYDLRSRIYKIKINIANWKKNKKKQQMTTFKKIK